MREYLDFRIDLTGLDSERFFVQASCRLGETRGITEVRYRPALVEDMTAALADQSAAPTDLLEFATTLGNMLFPGEVADLFRSVFPHGTGKDGIRLRLMIRDSALHAIPWEYAHLPLEGDASPTQLAPYLALHPAVSIVRHQAQPVPRPTVTPLTRGCRILAASALDLPGLDPLSGAEPTIIARALHEAEGGESGRFGFDLTALEDPATPDLLEDALHGEFDIFHFSGHSMSRTRLDGTTSNGWAISDGKGGKRLIQPSSLAAMLLQASVRVAVFNTCTPPAATGADRLQPAAQLVDGGVPAVVAMQFPVEDAHALAFSKGFYSALAAGLSLDEAVSLGRRRMQELGVLANWGAPVTFNRSSDGLIFVSRGPAGAASQAGGKAPRMVAYQAGRDVPPERPVEPSIRRAIVAFCADWVPPQAQDERAEISALSVLDPEEAGDGRRAPDGRPHDKASALLRLLGASYPEPVPEDELVWRLNVAQRRSLAALRRRVDQRLETRQRDGLLQYSVEVIDHQAGDGRSRERGYRLRRLPIARLLDRSPEAHGVIDYRLKHALSLYDFGRYAECVNLMVGLFETLQNRRGGLTIPEHALFFYYLSKALLKLNWYEELQLVLEGPYLRLSHSVLQDLEVERLHVAGIRLRQLGNLTAAQACFDDAVNALMDLPGAAEEPVFLRSLGDSHVLQAQSRLTYAVSSRQPVLARAAALRMARESMDRAAGFFERLREATGTGTHYEGRLYGTRAFLGVATSLVQPETMDAADWPALERFARSGFEPIRERKPFGVVAGKFALSMVLLAKARWCSLYAQGRPGGGDVAARSALEEANRLLQSLFEGYLEPGHVQLGATFEMPKVRLAADTVEELLRRQSPNPDVWQEVTAREAVWSPLA